MATGRGDGAPRRIPRSQRPKRRAIPGASDRLRLIPSALIDISGTDIRRRVAAHESIRYRAPPAVEQYIRAHNLYIPSA